MEIQIAVVYKIGITAGLTSVREMAHTDSIQTPLKSPDCLLGEVTQPSDSRLSETR